MGIFGSIKDAIFGKKTEAKPTWQADNKGGHFQQAGQGTATQTAPRPAETSQVDVEARLDAMSGADNLNWRTSIVDLMKLLRIDSSFENRKELATELGDSDYSGTAEENIALHRRTMQELAKNGGKVPANFLD